jgi:hypothetical protein
MKDFDVNNPDFVEGTLDEQKKAQDKLGNIETSLT